MTNQTQQNQALPKGWENIQLGNVVFEYPKSQIQVGHALKEGAFSFFTSGEKILFFDKYLVDNEIIYLATGGIANVKYFSGKASYSTDTYAITSKNKNVKYLYYSILLHLDYINRQFFTGSGLKHLQKNDLKVHNFLFPKSLPEQQKIAEILTTVDETIEKTDQLIKKHERLKQGMMQDLLTKGIDEGGNIRSEETHKFRDSELGRIPMEWEVATLESLLSNTSNSMRSGPFGSALLKSELVTEGIPLLGIDNIFIERFNNIYTRFVSKSKYSQLEKYTVKGRDVVITIMGTVGRSCVIPDDIGIALSSKHIWTMSLNFDKYIPELLSWQLNFSDVILKDFRCNGQGGIMDSINSKILKTLKLPKPNIKEQKRIFDVYTKLNTNIENSNHYHQKLHSLKNGLIEDLLTGKVRTNHLLTVK